jgi:hypothetical protein
MVNHMSISQDVYLGYSQNDELSVYCSISSGILFSNVIFIFLNLYILFRLKNHLN